LTHGRTRKRYAQRVALVVVVIAGAILFVAWAIGLALLILIVTN
jgi:ABC-type transporter Mla subunit MlaD